MPGTPGAMEHAGEKLQTVHRPIFRASIAGFPYRLLKIGFLVLPVPAAGGAVLAPLAVDQATCFRADGEQRVGSLAASEAVSWTVTETCTSATRTRRVRPHAVKMSLQANRLFTKPACIAGVRRTTLGTTTVLAASGAGRDLCAGRP